MLTTIHPEPGRKHNGVVVKISRPNRYDFTNGRLLSGPPGDFLKDTIRSCDVDPAECIYTLDPYFNIGRKNLILGDDANRKVGPGNRSDLNSGRGYVYCETVATYLPVDCTDIVDHEHGWEDDDGDDEDDAGNTQKDSAPTARRNYRFWFKADIAKLLKGERRTAHKFTVLRDLSTHEVIKALNSLSNSFLYFDIETHPPSDTVQCFTFASPIGAAIQVPVYDHRGQSCHTDLPKLFAALCRCMQRNVTVGHNLSFDLGFLFHFHGVPFSSSIYDTMLAQHRCFPEAEKSLAHTMSYWLNVPNHKGDAGTFTPYNRNQFQQLLDYNTNDVLVLREIHNAQLKHASNDVGLMASITQANDVSFEYLAAGFTGFEVDVSLLRSKLAKTDALLKDLERVLVTLTGIEGFNPASPQQVGAWLYEGLCYPIVDKTDSGEGATGMKALYKLLLKNPQNVALKLVILYRTEAQSRKMLGFEHYYTNEDRKS